MNCMECDRNGVHRTVVALCYFCSVTLCLQHSEVSATTVATARHGESVLLEAGGLSCPAAAAAFGFRPLPPQLAPRIPDVVVVEGTAEVLMWLLLADLNIHRGERRIGNTAVLQATCVDATVIPHLEQRLNFSLGCYGCREATDLTPGEAVLGFPGALLDPLLGALKGLGAKALPRSRAKLAHGCLAGSPT